MNMNKIIKFLLVIIISFLFLSANTYAASCSSYASQGEEVCISKSNNGYKCEWNGSRHGGARCKEGDVPSEETLQSITSCSDITKSEVCSNANINGKACIWRQNACYTAEEDNPNNDRYQINTEEPNKNNSFIENNDTNTKIPCNTYNEQQCGTIRKCEWNKVENECQETYVAEQPCSDDSIKIALRFFGYLLMIAKVAIPLIIIIMGTLDLFNSVVDKDEKSLTKQLKILLMRIVAGIFVFFLPNIVYALFSISSSLNIVEEAKYKDCVDCVLKPNICKTNKKN